MASPKNWEVWMVDYPKDEGGFLTHASVMIVFETRSDIALGIYVTSQDEKVDRDPRETDVSPRDYAKAGLSESSVIRCHRVRKLEMERILSDGSYRKGELTPFDQARVTKGLRLAGFGG